MAKNKMLQVRLTEDEKRIADALAKEYNLRSTSELVRNAILFLHTTRPTLVIEKENINTVIEPRTKHDTVSSFRRGWEQALAGDTISLDELWDGIDVE